MRAIPEVPRAYTRDADLGRLRIATEHRAQLDLALLQNALRILLGQHQIHAHGKRSARRHRARPAQRRRRRRDEQRGRAAQEQMKGDADSHTYLSLGSGGMGGGEFFSLAPLSSLILVSLHLRNQVDFDWHSQRKGGDAHRRTRVHAALLEDLAQQVGATVEHRGPGGERGVGLPFARDVEADGLRLRAPNQPLLRPAVFADS